MKFPRGIRERKSVTTDGYSIASWREDDIVKRNLYKEVCLTGLEWKEIYR